MMALFGLKKDFTKYSEQVCLKQIAIFKTMYFIEKLTASGSRKFPVY